jgi:hypothetical protein
MTLRFFERGFNSDTFDSAALPPVLALSLDLA